MSGWQRWFGVRTAVILMYAAGAGVTVAVLLLLVLGTNRPVDPAKAGCVDTCGAPPILALVLLAVIAIVLCLGLVASLIVATVDERRRIRAGHGRVAGGHAVLESATTAVVHGLMIGLGIVLAALVIGLVVAAVIQA
jgi:hypothetical protein